MVCPSSDGYTDTQPKATNWSQNGRDSNYVERFNEISSEQTCGPKRKALVIQHSYGKSLCSMEQATIDGDFP